jgi:hypothetical protein
MIPISLAPEPPEFDDTVRQPGLSAIDEMAGRAPRLKRSGRKRRKLADAEKDIPADEFPPYWRDVLPEMRVPASLRVSGDVHRSRDRSPNR